MNEFITESDSSLVRDLEQVEMIIGYRFKNKKLLKQALTHESCEDEDCQSYERLEYLGDSVLNLMFAREHFFFFFLKGGEHYFLYPKMKSGELTQLRAANVDTEALARVAFKHGLHGFLKHQDLLLEGRVQELMEGMKEYPSHSYGLINPPKILADIVESVVGDVYVDTNFSIDGTWGGCEELVTTFDHTGKHRFNPVKKLNEMCQKMGIKLEYKNSWIETGDIEIYMDNELIGKGNCKKKKIIAKNRAAVDAYKNLVKQLNLINGHMDLD